MKRSSRYRTTACTIPVTTVATSRSCPTPGGWPLWTFGVRPGREHDTICAKTEADLLSALEKAVAEEDLLTLTDLGYENLSPAVRHPAKKPAHGELTDE